MNKIFLLVLISCWLFASCINKREWLTGISTDSSSIQKGKILFTQNCSSCHNFKTDGIGPHLGGLTESVSIDWIQRFIKNPKEIIESKDQRAVVIFKKFKSVMPAFSHYNDGQLDELVAFLHTQKSPKKKKADNRQALSNPIPDTIKASNLILDIELINQFPATKEKPPLARITKMGYIENTNRLFVLDLQGKLYEITTKKPVVFMDISVLRPKFVNDPGLATGFGSFAFHPEFMKNGLLYTTHSEKAQSADADFGYAENIPVALQWVLTEWKTNQPGASTFMGDGRELLRINMVSPIHGVQEIVFNPLLKPGDEGYGLLFMGIGDGGCVENGFPQLVHDPSKIWGSVIRIDPSGRNSANRKYGIPPGNPFAGSNSQITLGEIFSYGYRNPHRITWTKSGKMLVSNIGQHEIEALYITKTGSDHGWPKREGTFEVNPSEDINKVFPLDADDSLSKITYPVAQYDHGEGNAISGGYEYRGTRIPELVGKFIFGDILHGRLFYVNEAELIQGNQARIYEWWLRFNGDKINLKNICKDNRVDLHFGQDYNGELYVMTKADGKLYRIVKKQM